MKHPVLPTDEVRPLPFYLAMEEWIARSLPADDYFFAWRVEPTVICGRNQDIEKEVNLEYCKNNNIRVVRRRSGGGCVYADMNNWMFSYITPSSDVTSTFARYTSMVANMVRSLGFQTSATGRNDILVGDKKIAGNAFYHLPDRAIVHGTMLYDIDFGAMANAITPSRAKLESKAVKSVESHVTSLTDEGIKMSVEEFGDYALKYLCDEDVMLSEDDVRAIKEIEQRYYDPEYIKGRHPSANDIARPDIERKQRIDGVGEFDAKIYLDNNHRIKHIALTGDFFVTGDFDKELLRPLLGLEYTAPELERALSTTNPSSVITGLNKEQLLSLLIQNKI